MSRTTPEPPARHSPSRKTRELKPPPTSRPELLPVYPPWRRYCRAPAADAASAIIFGGLAALGLTSVASGRVPPELPYATIYFSTLFGPMYAAFRASAAARRIAGDKVERDHLTLAGAVSTGYFVRAMSRPIFFGAFPMLAALLMLVIGTASGILPATLNNGMDVVLITMMLISSSAGAMAGVFFVLASRCGLGYGFLLARLLAITWLAATSLGAPSSVFWAHEQGGAVWAIPVAVAWLAAAAASPVLAVRTYRASTD